MKGVVGLAVSKRLRYEVLRRDNHACRYCGRNAPEVKLTVDHVLAVALGGTDEPTNLVACCSDCNSGKTSTTADATLIADVSRDALRFAAATHAAMAKSSDDLAAVLDYRSKFLQSWQPPLPLDDEWEQTIEHFRARGLSIQWLEECVRIAMGHTSVPSRRVFRYMCGVAWRQIEKIEASARALFEGDCPPERLSLEDRLTASAIETAALAWRAQYCQAYGCDPAAALEAEVRAYAAELVPEEVSAADVVAAAERAGNVGSSALPDFVETITA
jgi:hypothetical protein